MGLLWYALIVLFLLVIIWLWARKNKKIVAHEKEDKISPDYLRSVEGRFEKGI